MIARFRIRNLMVQVAPEDHPEKGHPPCGPHSNQQDSICSPGSCGTGDRCRDYDDAVTNCGIPTCMEPPKRREAGVDEPAPGNLALLQKELRREMILEKGGHP